MEELFKPGRLQLFFHTLPFGSVVLSQSRGQNAPPLTQRVATLSPEAPAPVPIARMTVGSRRELDHLVGWGKISPFSSFSESSDVFLSLSQSSPLFLPMTRTGPNSISIGAPP